MRRKLLVLAAVTMLFGCDPSPDVREWTPQDHDQAAGQTGQTVPQRSAQPADDAGLVELAWAKNCVVCHGPRGRGDGPQGPMVKAPDLTRADWQQKATDDEIATIIRKGKDKMPAFDLPPPVLAGLVKRIRASRAQ